MPAHSRLDVFNAMLMDGLIPIFYHADRQAAINVLTACQKGGARFLEFTNRGDFAIDVFKELAQFCRQKKLDFFLGAGTVMDSQTAAQYLAYGADFIVSPILNEDLLRFCNRRKIACLPGCATASEISRAEEFGAEIVKVFPGSTVGGPDFVRNLLGPMPWTRIIPTGGIEAEYDNLSAWFSAGVAGVGMGTKLIRSEYVKTESYDQISDLVSRVLKWITQIKTDKKTG
ncbi:MAG: bifunctional 4-hydroxy-2-oxoglutarate aldolase/2-dehydro-3-deoxy-phosphogluconate aldolase [Acidobacteriaceae bacterium]